MRQKYISVFSSAPDLSSKRFLVEAARWKVSSQSGVSFCLWCEILVSCFNKLRREKQGKAKQKKRRLHALIGNPGPFRAPLAPEGCLGSKCCSSENCGKLSCCSHLLQIYIQSAVGRCAGEKFPTARITPPSLFGQPTMRAWKDLHKEGQSSILRNLSYSWLSKCFFYCKAYHWL